MLYRKIPEIAFRLNAMLPNNCCNEVSTTKYFITNLLKICLFLIIYTNKNRTIISQKITRKK